MTQISLNLPELESERISLGEFLARPDAYNAPDFTTKNKRFSELETLIGKAKGEDEGDPFAGIDESKVDALMSEMEGEMAGLDDNNPNPRQIGHLMRKLTDVMGDRTPESLKELVHRLEAGEDPEKLEEQFGDFDGDNPDGAPSAAADALWDTVKKRIKSLRDQPMRDPKLYDMADFISD